MTSSRQHQNPSASSSGAAADKDATVLIVEDEPDMASLYEAALSDHYQTIVAHDGQAGYDAMTPDIDVVLLDRRMPKMTGDEALQAIKEDGYPAAVVMVSAVDPDVDLVDLPVDDYLTKPVRPDELRDVVDRMLHLKHADSAVRRYHSLERRRDLLRAEKARTGAIDMEVFDLLTRRLESAARDAGAGLAYLDGDDYGVADELQAD